jgi:hypothetical protein
LFSDDTAAGISCKGVCSTICFGWHELAEAYESNTKSEPSKTCCHHERQLCQTSGLICEGPAADLGLTVNSVKLAAEVPPTPDPASTPTPEPKPVSSPTPTPQTVLTPSSCSGVNPARLNATTSVNWVKPRTFSVKNAPELGLSVNWVKQSSDPEPAPRQPKLPFLHQHRVPIPPMERIRVVPRRHRRSSLHRRVLLSRSHWNR